MAKEHILFDKTEIIVAVSMGNNMQLVNLPASSITSITIAACEERKLLVAKPSEMISIVTSRMGEPITMYKSKEAKYWESYKKGLEDFAAYNRISFHKNV